MDKLTCLVSVTGGMKRAVHRGDASSGRALFRFQNVQRLEQPSPENVETKQDPRQEQDHEITTSELRISSFLLGQDTLFISASTAIRKSANFGKLTIR